MKMLLYHNTIISDYVPNHIDLISEAFKMLGYNIFDKGDLCKMYDAKIPGVYYQNGIGCIMDYIGYRLVTNEDVK